jgi:hypothetical protein
MSTIACAGEQAENCAFTDTEAKIDAESSLHNFRNAKKQICQPFLKAEIQFRF